MSQANTQTENPARERHWVYGFNAALLVAIGVVVLGFLFYFANRSAGSTWATYDWSSGGINSLSGSTQRLLKEVEAQNQTFKIYSLFPARNDIEKRENVNAEQDEHRRQILDLLQQYARRSKNITVEDYGSRSTEEILQEISSTFAGETKPYKEAIDAFDPLANKVVDFLGEQATMVGARGQASGATADQLQQATQIQALFKGIPGIFSELKKEVKQSRDATIPHWGEIHDALVEKLSDQRLLDVFSMLGNKDTIKKMDMPPALAAYFTENADKYKDIFDQLKAYIDRLTKLKPLQGEPVLARLEHNSVVVLGGGSAKVLNSSDLYTMPRGGDGSTVRFSGEQAISSALLAILRPDKVKVVFVGFPRDAALDDAKDVLKAANFDTMDWSPPAPQAPGAPPEPSDPPASGKGVVWIVSPPAPDMQMMQMGMPGAANAGPIIAATRKHMSDGGQVMFVAEAAVTNPAMGLMGSPFPYDELIKDFGIEVQSKFTVVTEEVRADRSGQQTSQTAPYVRLNRFEPHEITTAMEGFPVIFAPVRSAAPGFPTVVGVRSPMPEGAMAKVIIQSPADSWGETDWDVSAKYDPGKDLKGPVPVAAVSVRNAGQKDKEQRIAVIGSKQFMDDSLLEATDVVQSGNSAELVLLFPGNSELLKNTVLWLAGYENMIAVSPRVNQAGRIGDVSPGKLLAVRVLVAGVIPALALLLGGMVWMIRRR